HRRDDHERDAHRDAQRNREWVAAVVALRDHQRRRQQHDRDQPARVQKRAQRAADDRRLGRARRLGHASLSCALSRRRPSARAAPEIADLMSLLRRFVLEERKELAAQGIRLVAIGDTARLPVLVRGPLAALTEATRANRGMTLCLALSYGGRESIVRAAQRLA